MAITDIIEEESLTAGAPSIKYTGDMTKDQGIGSMASRDPFLENEYKKYVIEMEEQDLEPMSFEEFEAQARAGMANGGITPQLVRRNQDGSRPGYKGGADMGTVRDREGRRSATTANVSSTGSVTTSSPRGPTPGPDRSKVSALQTYNTKKATGRLGRQDANQMDSTIFYGPGGETIDIGYQGPLNERETRGKEFVEKVPEYPEWTPAWAKAAANFNNTPNRKFFFEKVIRGGKIPGLNYDEDELENAYQTYMDNRLAGKTDAYGNPTPGPDRSKVSALQTYNTKKATGRLGRQDANQMDSTIFYGPGGETIDIGYQGPLNERETRGKEFVEKVPEYPEWTPAWAKAAANFNNTPNRKFFFEKVIRGGKIPGLNYDEDELENAYQTYMDNRLAGKTDAYGNPTQGFSYDDENLLTGNFIDSGADFNRTTEQNPNDPNNGGGGGSDDDDQDDWWMPLAFRAEGGRVGLREGGPPIANSVQQLQPQAITETMQLPQVAQYSQNGPMGMFGFGGGLGGQRPVFPRLTELEQGVGRAEQTLGKVRKRLGNDPHGQLGISSFPAPNISTSHYLQEAMGPNLFLQNTLRGADDMTLGRSDEERIGRAFGGMMGDDGRRAYGLGSIFKKVKKVFKSPLGKMALLGGLGMLTGGAGASSFMGKLKGSNFLKSMLLKDGAGAWTMKNLSPWKAIGLSGGLSGLVAAKDYKKYDDWGDNDDGTGLGDLDQYRNYYNQQRAFRAEGGDAESGLMDMGGMEKDYREDGGFVPIGGKEKADDVPARLSKNEFVMTADAVRGAGDGDIDKGAEVMYNVMKNLEAGGGVSEETQGLDGAREMFQTSQRLEEVL